MRPPYSELRNSEFGISILEFLIPNSQFRDHRNPIALPAMPTLAQSSRDTVATSRPCSGRTPDREFVTFHRTVKVKSSASARHTILIRNGPLPYSFSTSERNNSTP